MSVYPTIRKYVDGVRYNGNLIYLTYVVEEYNTRSTVQLYTIRRAWLDYCVGYFGVVQVLLSA